MEESGGRYGGAAIMLHWLTAVLIVANVMLGLSMVPLPIIPRKLQWYAWHKWIGITVFVLALARVAWRLTHPAPALPATLPAWERRAAATSHLVLYILIMIIPLTGWLYSSASGVPTVYLGVLPLPDLLTRDKALAEALKLIHVSLNYTMLVLVIIHASAALKHYVIDRDDVLARMLPIVKSRGEQ